MNKITVQFCRMFSGMTFVYLIDYIFHFVLSRRLGPAEYGYLGASLALFAVVNDIMGGVYPSMNYISAKNKALHEPGNIIKATKIIINKLSLYAVLLLAIFIVLRLAAKELFSFIPIWFYMLIVCTGVFSWLRSLLLSIFQGLEHYRELIRNLFISALIGKVMIALLLVYLGFGVHGAFFGVLLGIMISIVFAIIVLKKSIGEKTSSVSEIEMQADMIKYVRLVCYGYLIWAIFSKSDLIFARIQLEAVEAGYFTASRLVIKGLLAVLFPLIMVVSPKIATRKTLNKDYRTLIRKSMVFALLFTLTVTLFFQLFSGQVVALLFGKAYMDIVPALLRLMPIIYCPYLLAFVLMDSMVASGYLKYIAGFIAIAVLKIFLFYQYGHRLPDMLIIIAATNLLMFLLMYIYYGFSARSRPVY